MPTNISKARSDEVIEYDPDLHSAHIQRPKRERFIDNRLLVSIKTQHGATFSTRVDRFDTHLPLVQIINRAASDAREDALRARAQIEARIMLLTSILEEI